MVVSSAELYSITTVHPMATEALRNRAESTSKLGVFQASAEV